MTTSAVVEISKEEAIAAVTAAAWEEEPRPEAATCGHPGCTDHPGKGRMMIHCMTETIGMDIPLVSVIAEIQQAQRCAWVDGFLGHHLAVRTANGRKRYYEASALATGAAP